MNSKNNGKIVLGVLIMFVVALSIIGVTYAYFVATFTNNNNPESVKITAGELIANYSHGTSIDVTNVVPGWVSDGLHYYDVDVAAAQGGHIYATKAASSADVGKGYAIERYGIAQPISFSVSNNSESDDTIAYAIYLNVMNNGIYEESIDTDNSEANKALYAADKANLLVSLYKGTFDISKGVADNFGDGNELLTGPFVLADTGEQIMVTAPETIAKGGAANNYFVVFEYVNQENTVQISQGLQLKVEAEIKGIQEDNAGNDVWYDEDNREVTFATASTLTKTAATDDAATDFYNSSALVPVQVAG